MFDEIVFAEDTEEEEREDHGSWKVLIVDDEPFNLLALINILEILGIRKENNIVSEANNG